jgi:predicted ATPase
MTLQEKTNNKDLNFKSNPIVSVDDPMAFNQKVLDARLAQYNDSLKSKEEVVFFDRGVHDVLGYMNCFDQKYGQDFAKVSEETQYDGVFIMPPWPEIFKRDNERFESYEEALSVDAALMDIYGEYGYEVCVVPKDSVEKRADFILSYLNTFK